ncbi:hypothetical protein NHG32_06470 [Aerococcaceae bacterium NML191219]|nr:hypothetical protein [Aerococcaceae bacterium NML191219]
MKNEIFQSELRYQVTMLHASRLLNQSLISLEEFEAFQKKMIEMYRPILSEYMDETLDKSIVLSDI